MFFRFRFDVGLISYGDICPTLIANDNGGADDLSHGVLYVNELKQVGQLYGTEREPNPQAGRIYSADGISPCLDTCQGGCRMPKIGDGIRVRKLTPRECFRLQGFPDEYFDRAAEVCSDSQLYKQAGNSVTVNVIYEIAKRFKEEEQCQK